MRMRNTAVLPSILTFWGLFLLSVAFADGLCVHAANSAGQSLDEPESIPFLCDENGILTGIDPGWLMELALTGEPAVPLVLPSSVDGIPVTGIAPQAFWAERYQEICPGLHFTDLQLPDVGLRSVGEYAFYGCGGSGNALFLPDSLQNVGSHAFYDTSYTTVYLTGSETVFGDSSFGGSSLRSLICPDSDTYTRLSSQSIVDFPDRLTWVLTLRFQDEDGWTLASPRQALYHMPLNYLPMEDGSWAETQDYSLPPLADSSGAYTWFWVFDTDQEEPVLPSTRIQGDVLTAVKRIGPPQITFGEDIRKIYDGTPASLSVDASHPLASSPEKARSGSVLFCYTWTWTDENGAAHEEEGYDLSTLEFTDSCRLSVTVLVHTIAAGDPDSVLDECVHTFHVQIGQAEPTVEVEPPSSPLLVKDGLPELLLGEGSTPGSICWEEGQALSEGVHEYRWLFTPQDSRNYVSAAGTLLLDARLYPSSSSRAEGASSPRTERSAQPESPSVAAASAEPSAAEGNGETAGRQAEAAVSLPALCFLLLLSAVLTVLFLLRKKRKRGRN